MDFPVHRFRSHLKVDLQLFNYYTSNPIFMNGFCSLIALCFYSFVGESVRRCVCVSHQDSCTSPPLSNWISPRFLLTDAGAQIWWRMVIYSKLASPYSTMIDFFVIETFVTANVFQSEMQKEFLFLGWPTNSWRVWFCFEDKLWGAFFSRTLFQHEYFETFQ